MQAPILFILLLAGLISSVQAEEVHQVAVRTHSGVEAGIKTWGPTIDYLSKTISGHRFEMVPYPQIDKQLEDARQNKFEFVFTNPSTYVEMKHLTGAHALVTLINKRQNTAQTRFGSVIFTRADRDDIVTLADLNGKHLIAVSPLGFGGWQVAWREMLQNGFDPHTSLGKLSFADGSQPAVVKAVANGSASAGVVRTDMLERMAQKGDISLTEFRILHNIETEGFPFFHSTPLYPEWSFAAMAGTETKLVAQVKQVLLEMKENHPAARAGNYQGWTEALDYSEVDELLKELGVANYAKTKQGAFTPVIILLLLLTIVFITVLVLKRQRQKTA